MKVSAGKSDGFPKSKKLRRFVCSVIVFVTALLYIGKTCGIPGMADDMGYIGTAATFAGYDWSGVMWVEPYYSFIYSATLVPIMMLPFSAVTLYRIIMVWNAVLLVGAFLTSCLSIEELKIFESERFGDYTCLAVAVYTANSYNAQNASGETLLYFLFWALVYCSIRFSKHTTIGNEVLLVLVSVLNFAAHMRNVGTMCAAAIITVIVICRQYKGRKKYRALLLMLAIYTVSLFAFHEARNAVVNYVFQNGNAVRVNNVSGQSENVMRLFSRAGVGQFGILTAARLFYLGGASFLLMYYFLQYSVRIVLKDMKVSIRRKEHTCSLELFNVLLLVLLSLLSCIAVSNIYYLGSQSTIHYVLYGRYCEHVMGPVLILGIADVLKSRPGRNYLQLALYAAIQLLFCVIVNTYLNNHNITAEGNVQNIVVFAGLINFKGVEDVVKYTFEAYFLTSIVGVWIVSLLTLKNSAFHYLGIAVAGTCWFVILLSFYSKYLYTDGKMQNWHNDAAAADYMDQCGIDSILLPFDGKVFSGGHADARTLQFLAKDVRIELVSMNDLYTYTDSDFLSSYPYIVWGKNVLLNDSLKNIIERDYVVCFGQGNLVIYRRTDLEDTASVSSDEDQSSHADLNHLDLIHVDLSSMQTTRKASAGWFRTNVYGRDGGLLVGENENIWGPNVTLSPGAWTVTFTMKCLDNNVGDGSLAILRVESNIGKNTVKERKITGDLFAGEGTNGTSVQEISVPLSFETSRGETLDNVEFKLYMTGDAELEITDITYSHDDSYAEIFAEDSAALNNITNILALDSEGLDVDVVMNEYERNYWRTDTLHDALDGHKVRVIDSWNPEGGMAGISDASNSNLKEEKQISTEEENQSNSLNQNAVLLVPAADYDTLFQLLGQFTVLYRGTYYALLAPSGRALASRYVEEGGTALSHETLLDMRYFGMVTEGCSNALEGQDIGVNPDTDEGFEAVLPDGEYILYFQMLNKSGNIYPSDVTVSIQSTPVITLAGAEDDAGEDGEMTEIDYNATVNLSDDTLFTETFPVKFAADTKIDGTYSADSSYSDILYAAYIGRIE